MAASVLERPTGSPMYRDERVALGFYSLDTSLDVTSELAAISNLFIRTFESAANGLRATRVHLQSDNTKRGHDLVGQRAGPARSGTSSRRRPRESQTIETLNSASGPRRLAISNNPAVRARGRRWNQRRAMGHCAR